MGANAQLNQPVQVSGEDYEYVAPSAAAQVLGVGGLKGDSLGRIVANVTTSATSAVSIKDGANAAIVIIPANTPIGAYSIMLGIRSVNGPWQVTTDAGVSVIATGKFAS